ncbi:phospholipase D/transphosphatidylase [Oscillochloris trichoides DG-6]|uniref:phospholipase D n=1 Tax=Oscillochloris trichoides DG-6 TaxID=765420 RepID=E1IHC3_9CHLR|nr:phospholipase D-like domain-containing protein [Oscillochloris trichoides]EFO79376.1 phospholipase D/transphosphatidylase [Oscillochloris trichoides DG-6]
MSSRRSPQSTAKNILGTLIVVIILGIGYLFEQGLLDLSRFGLESSAPPVASNHQAIEVFFTTPSLIYPDVPKNRLPPPHEQAIIADIDAATRSIDMVTFEFNLSSISQALVRAKQRGVEVRLALDREELEDPVMAKWAGVVEDAGIPISWQESDAFLHSKFIIIDEQVVWMGSWNTTINDTYRNNNNLLRITIPELVANYQTEFEQMMAGRFSTSKQKSTPNPVIRYGNGQIENYFSPKEKPRQRIVEYISQARERIDFLAFSYTSDDIAQAMIERHNAGVVVRGVFEKRNAQGIGSEYPILLDAGVDVLSDGNCYTMHHKVIIIDRRIVITGSYNFTGRAEDLNDENLLIIDDPQLAELYMQEFERVFGQAERPTQCG